MTRLVEFINSTLNNGDYTYVVSIFIGWRKAFDTVDHCVLQDKFSRCVVRGISLEFMYGYLKNRTVMGNFGESVKFPIGLDP